MCSNGPCTCRKGTGSTFGRVNGVAAGYTVVDAPLGKIPVFVRGGAVVPLGNVRQSTDEPLGELTLRIYPAGESSFMLTEDAGDGYGFEQGEVARTKVVVTQDGEGVRVEVSAREGSFTPAARQVVLEVYTQKPGWGHVRRRRSGYGLAK